ncbi:MAG: hypothetical protein ACYS0I_21345 [Planctomycetota bacterium]
MKKLKSAHTNHWETSSGKKCQQLIPQSKNVLTNVRSFADASLLVHLYIIINEYPAQSTKLP